MAKKILIASGDSWTAGTNPLKPDSYPYWPEILANKLGMDYINVGRGGKGNEFIYNQMVDTLCSTKTKRVGLAICLWSKFDRWDLYKWTFAINPKYRKDPSYWGGRYVAKYWPEKTRHEKFVSAIYEHGDLSDGGENLLRSMRKYHSFQNYCELHNIPYLQGQAFRPSEDILKEFFDCPQFDVINDNKFVGWPIYKELGGKSMWEVLDEVDPKQTKLRVSKSDLHPNGEGHERIAKIMYERYKKIYE